MPRQILKINKDDTSTEEAVFCTLPRLLHSCASLIALDPCSFSPTLRPGTSLAPAGVVVAYVNRAACCVSCSPRRNELLSGAEAVPRTRCTHTHGHVKVETRSREGDMYISASVERSATRRAKLLYSVATTDRRYLLLCPNSPSRFTVVGEHKPTLYQAPRYTDTSA